MYKNPLLEKVDGIVHGFGTRSDKMSEIFPTYWRNRPVQHERHGTRVAVVEHHSEDCGEADGMFTKSDGLLLSIATADCVPVLLANMNGKEVAALHVGWRGAYDGIVQKFVELLRSQGGSPSDWYAAIGPSAGKCCYDVSAELIKQFQERFNPPEGIFIADSLFLNLPGIAHWQLEQAGFGKVSVSSECTICHRNSAIEDFTFHSYRRDRETRVPMQDVQWSVIAISDSVSDEKSQTVSMTI